MPPATNIIHIDTISDFIAAVRLRYEVFVNEQKFKPGWEPDEDDKTAQHWAITLDGKILSVLRFRRLEDQSVKIERMATDKQFRGNGYGSQLLKKVLSVILEEKPARVWITAQVSVEEFYSKSGFVRVDKPYELYGVQHITMEYPVK